MARTPLKIIVELFRLAGKPANHRMYLPISLHYTPEINSLILELMALNNADQYAEDLEFDGKISQNEDPPLIWHELNITLKPPRDKISRFHGSIEDFITFTSLRNGDFPDDFYIVDIDYHPSDLTKPDIVLQVEKICKLIKSLAKLAHYHDRKSSDGEPRLVFIQGSDGKSSSAIIQPLITREMLFSTDFDCSFVEQLQEENSSDDINHHIEKRGIFRNTLVEFINDNSLEFSGLVKKWTEFRLSYDNNLSVYLSGFNFHKARKEVASAELEFAEKTSKTLSELTTKTLALPISMLAALGVWKLGEITEQLLVFVGVMLTTITIHLLVMSQKKQLFRITHAKNLIFSPFTKSLKKYPEELQDDIKKALESLNKNEIFSKRILNTFYILCWLPTLTAFIIILYKYFLSQHR